MAVCDHIGRGPRGNGFAQGAAEAAHRQPEPVLDPRKGLRVRVTVKVRKLRRGQRLSRRARRNPIRIKLHGTATSFDAPRLRKIARDKVAEFPRANRRGVASRVVRLRLTQARPAHDLHLRGAHPAGEGRQAPRQRSAHPHRPLCRRPG